VAIDWTLDLFFPRDIVYLRPLHATRGAEVATLSDEPQRHEEHKVEIS
jgi:hypothetical protein